MIFQQTKLNGVYVIKLEKIFDERGYFARSFCLNEFAKNGINFEIKQANISFNAHKGTFRGMHYQGAPYEEAKIVHCTKGAIYDYILDLRKDSQTFKDYIEVYIKAEDDILLYLPKGIAHGFLTDRDNTEIHYLMSEFYHPECSFGVRYNDPAFNLKLSADIKVIAKKDLGFRDFK